MKGYKAFNKGLVCRGKQYAENTVFEEDSAKICESGMHFCENPLDCLDYYPLINDSGYNSTLAGGDNSTLAGGSWSKLAGGKHSIMIGDNGSIAKGKKGSLIVLVEREWVNNEYVIKAYKAELVDGERIKEDVFYKLENGEFVEVNNDGEG